MIFFRNLRPVDRVTFEGREVKQAIPVTDRETKRVMHYHMVVADGVGGTTLRKFRTEEIAHLIERELLIIDRGYYSLARETDRTLYGDELVDRAALGPRGHRAAIRLIGDGDIRKHLVDPLAPDTVCWRAAA